MLPPRLLWLRCRLLELHPDNATVLDAAAELLAELGDAAGALELVTRSVELEPRGGAGKYVLLGHLEHGERAAAAFGAALDMLAGEERSARAAEGDGSPAHRAARRSASAASAALAKVHLTDLFLEPGSADRAEALLDQALVFDPDSAEACQALADLRLSQGRRGEALSFMRRTTTLLERAKAEAAAGMGCAPRGRLAASEGNESAAGVYGEGRALGYSYDFRTVTARLLVELSEYAEAIALLEDLCLEDAEDTEVWYLLGLCHAMRGGKGGKQAARTALERAQGLLPEGERGSALGRQIAGLLARGEVRECDKDAFWSPRWWIGDDGAVVSPGGGEADGGAHTPGGGGDASAAPDEGAVGGQAQVPRQAPGLPPLGLGKGGGDSLDMDQVFEQSQSPSDCAARTNANAALLSRQASRSGFDTPPMMMDNDGLAGAV